MTFEEQLAEYRKAYGTQREVVKASASGEPVPPTEPKWDDEIELPTPQDPMAQVDMGAEVEVPGEVLRTRDERVTDNEEDNMANFGAYLDSDPIVQQHLPQMEALINEIMTQMADPNSPMTPEEAEKVFVQAMEENFSKYFK